MYLSGFYGISSLHMMGSQRCMQKNCQTCVREMQYIVVCSPNFMMLKNTLILTTCKADASVAATRL